MPQTSFAIDGNPSGANDFENPYGPGTTPGGYKTTGLYYVKRNIDMGGTTGCALPNDNVAVSGTKVSDGPIWPVSTTGPNPNGKTDLDYIDVAAEKVDVNGDIEDILYVGYMKCGGTGTWQAVLYLDDGDNLAPTQGDTNGDYLFNFDFAPSSGAVTVKMYQMVNGVWTAQTPPAGTFDGSAAGDYGEVAINLTTLGILPDDTCRTINVSGQGAAVTGGSLTSALKDLVVVEPLSISNCGAINIRKAATGAGLTTTDLFHYVLDQAPAADAGDDDIVHDSTLGKNLNGSGASTEPDTNYKEIDATITVGGTHNWTNVISQTDYKLVEDTIPSPWSLKTITCTYTDIFVSPPASKTVTLYTNGASTGTRFAIPPSTFANGTLAPASCTITNEVTSLTLNKVLPNDNGGTKTSADFVLSAKKTPGNTVVINKADPAANDASVGASALITPGTYVIAETPASTAGYTTSAWTCVDTAANNAPVTVTTANSVSSVAITQGQNVVCSITNDDQPAAVTLHKVVTNDNGGTATGSEFTLTLTPKAGGTAVINGADPAPTTTTTTLGAGISANISAGTYVLGETTTLTGYTGSSWTCTGGTLAGNELTVTNGATVTCYVVNDDQPATVTLHKVLPNDNGGTMTGDQFTLTLTPKAGGTAVINGVDPAPTTTTTTLGAGISNSNVSAGVYVVAESPASTTGYTSAWTCTGGTLAGNELTVTNGATVTCYVVNDDQPAAVTLHKVVTNDNGGTATGSEFTLTLTPKAGGTAVINGADPAPTTTTTTLGAGISANISAGTYVLGETTTLTGYTGSSWTCTGGTLAGNELTVTNGATVTCYVVNDDQPAAVTLHKVVTNDNGGTATGSEFTLTLTPKAGGTAVINGADPAPTTTTTTLGAGISANISAGTYVLGETTTLTGYTGSSWTCTGGTLTGNELTVTNGATVTCYVVNDDQPATVTLHKVLPNDNGGTMTGDQFTLTLTPKAGGTAVINGVDPAPTTTTTTLGAGISNSNVSAGVYVVAESPASTTGYTSAWTCTGGTLTGNELTVTNGATVTCYVVNDDQPATVTLHKVLPNDNGGTMTGDQFTLTLTPKAGGTAVINGVDPAPTTTTTTLGAGISNSNVSAGVYVVAESPASTTGYTSAWTCTGGTLTGNELTVTNGATVTCYVVNDDQPATVTLHKVLPNDNGGTMTGDQFTLTLTPKAGGTAVINGVDPAPTTTTTTLGAGISNSNVSAGVYVVAESPASTTGYTSAWTCTGGTLTGNELTVTNGATVTCYVVNDDQPATVTLHKVLPNDNGGTATGSQFTLTLTPKAGGTAVINGVDPAPTTTTTTLGAGISNSNVSAGVYVVAESPASTTGYTSAWTCTGGTLTGNELTVTNGATVTCYVVNDDQPATVTLHKVLPNDNGGTMTGDQFTLTLTPKAGGTAVINGVDPAPTTTTTTLGAGISNSNVSAGVYVVAESPASTTGYTSAWTCTGGTLTGNELTVTNGATVTCYVVNDDQPATVTLHKVLPNDNGGTMTGDQFTLTLTPKAGGTAVINGVDPAPTTTTTTLGAGISNSNVSAGVYVVAESPASTTGYTSAWTCTGGTLTGNELTVTNGATVTCYVVNDDQPATVTLHKVLPNDNGGTMTGDQFTLTLTPKAGGTAVINGVDPAPTTTTTTLGAGISNSNVSAGVYVVAESPASTTGYTSAWTCTGGTLTGNELTVTNGATVTCYVVNDDNASTVTLHKVVINDDGGTATGEEFFLTLTPSAGGAALIDDQDPAPSTSASDLGDGASSSLVNAGTYTLGEHGGPAGYTDLGWHCVVTGTTDVVAVDANDGITVGNGADITCYVTNDDQPATLTLTKIVNNDDGGNAGPGDFTLKATNNGQEYELSGAGGAATSTAPAGTYELSETGPAGYTPMNWACSINGSEMTTLEGTTINVPNGGVVSCEIVNDDLPVDLTLDKSDGGANAAPGTAFDYTLTITNIGERNVDLDEPVWVYDTLPAGMEFVTVPSTCEVAGSDVACEIDPALLPAGGEPVVITLTVRFLPGTPAGTYTNLAFVETDDDPAPDEPVCPSEIPVGGKAIPTNNVDCEDTPLTPVYGLTIVKAGLEASGTGWAPTDGVVDFGATVGYTLTVSATGNAPQTNVVVTDTLPVGMTYVADSGQCLDGVVCTVTYDAATHTVTATIATMAQGTSAVVSFRATVDAAPAVAAGTTYTWQGDNVGAVVSTEVPKVPSNTVTVKATHAELPKTGSAHLEVGGYGLLSMLLGVGFVIATKRRRDDETAYVTAE